MFGWVINRKSTAYPQVIPTPEATLDIVKQLTDDLASSRARIHRLELSYRELEASHEALGAAVHKLRGQVHGQNGGRPRLVRGADDIPAGDKDALRAHVGLAAGKKFIHSEE